MRRIELLEEGQAHGRIKEIYGEIERDFGSPFVGSVFRALGYHPEFLDSAWTQLRPNVESQAFLDLSHQISQRMNALAEVTFDIIDLYAWLLDHKFDKEDIRHILYTIEVLNYTNPKYLLATAAIIVGITGINNPQIKRRKASPVTSEEPEFPSPIPRIMAEQASKEVKEDYYDIADVMGVPVIPDNFQAFGKWPEFLRVVWNELKPAMRSSTFLDEARDVSAFTIEAAQELPYPVKLPDPGDDVRKIVETSISLYARVGVGTAGVRRVITEGERMARMVGRAAGERPEDHS